MAEKLNLNRFKSSGVYTVEIDETANVALTLSTGRLVIGSSKKGPINSVVQINQKPVGTVTTVNKEFLPGYTTITHIEQLQGFVHHKLQDFSATLSRYGLVDLVESRRMRLTGPATVYFDISLGNRTYRLPLWSMVGITSDVLDEVKRYLETHLQDFVVRVSLATHSLVGR